MFLLKLYEKFRKKKLNLALFQTLFTPYSHAELRGVMKFLLVQTELRGDSNNSTEFIAFLEVIYQLEKKEKQLTAWD